MVETSLNTAPLSGRLQVGDWSPLEGKRPARRKTFRSDMMKAVWADRRARVADVKRKRGRPSRFYPEMVQQVETLGGLGLNFSQIANVLGISHETWNQYLHNKPEFAEALKRGLDRANAKVTQSLFKNAIEQLNLGAQCFWLKNKAGWSDHNQLPQLTNVTITNVIIGKEDTHAT